jgi:hypothetical protein
MKLFPAFFSGAIGDLRNWISAGAGFVALIATPIAAILLCITLIGLPVAIGVLFVYVAGLYLAKILVGAYLGRELIGAKDSTGLPTLLGLLVGVAILQAVFLVPIGGGILRFAVLCAGLGALLVRMRQTIARV